MEFFDLIYPHRRTLESLYGKQTMAFLRANARTVGHFPTLTWERQLAYFLQFTMIFCLDDLAEHLSTLENPNPLNTLRRHAIRVMRAATTEDETKFNKIADFPPELVEKASVQQHLLADYSQRLLRHAGQEVHRRYVQCFEYYLQGIDSGTQMVKAMQRGEAAHLYTAEQYMHARCHSSAGILVTSASIDATNAANFGPHYAGVSMVDLAIVTEADVTSYFKEKMSDRRYGSLVTVNMLDWPIQVAGKSILTAARETMQLHNQVMWHLEKGMAFAPDAHKPLFKRYLDNARLCMDYSFFAGVDQINMRYGWFPVQKSEALASIINMDKYMGE